MKISTRASGVLIYVIVFTVFSLGALAQTTSSITPVLPVPNPALHASRLAAPSSNRLRSSAATAY